MEEIKLSDDVFEQIKDFKHWRLTEEQELLIDKLILNEELKEHYKNNKNVSSLKLIVIGVNNVMLNVFNKISKIGLVEIMTLISLFKKHN